MKAFVTVAELGAFARGAAQLGISPSALSQTIRSLEKRLGVRLFNRTTRSVSLTEAGERLFARMRPVFGEFDAALEEINSYRDRPAGTLRISAPQMAIIHLLQPILPAFQRKYPDVVLDLTSDESRDDIVAKGFDAGIRLGKYVDQDMFAVRLGPDVHQIAVASPEYLARCGSPKTPYELSEHRCINWRRTGQPGLYSWEFARDGNWFSVAVKGSLIVNDCAVALQAAIDGLGITVWTREWMTEQLQSGQLVALLEEWSPPTPGFFLYHPSRVQMPAALRAFIDVIREQSALIENSPGTGPQTVQHQLAPAG
ncbi:LysR substrate-binding domain-containing protein [Burkholderia anthina]|uniref:LysR substrate-binding domain-containing protein n=1 Tax=Burkholderia anthina TaxID=179879 RepID=UPI0018C4EA94|nr:LysR family transcriptional regulator [Burkholderia anthina]